MASPTDLDIYTRSLSGDRRPRTELFKKFFHGSSRVTRLGSGYEDLNDFLQDCFGNFLRTGAAWDKEGSLSAWIETVAVWTALQKQRQRDIGSRAAKGTIRMCAEIESEDLAHGEAIEAYAPPHAGPEDSPAARILDLLSESERAVFRKRAMEQGSWEETAAAADKPVSAVGPIFARVTARIARLFGGPPPMDDDLVPVFSRAAVDPLKAEGRAISLQLDNVFYSMTAEMRKAGLGTSHDARIVTLWDSAASGKPPSGALRSHLEECHYCTELLRALTLLQQALVAAPGTDFLLCPGSFTLANAQDPFPAAFEQHLAQCPTCKDEREKALEGKAPPPVGENEEGANRAAGRKIVWAVAALLVLGAVSFAGFRYAAARKAESALASASLTSDQQTPTVTVDPRYRDLVQSVEVDNNRIMASVLPINRARAKQALDQFSLGQTIEALTLSAQLAQSKDPGATMLYAMCLYRTQLVTDGYREMLKSEAQPPRDTFRCWIMFQFALMVGDKAVLNREAGHLAADPKYNDQVKKIMGQVQERG